MKYIILAIALAILSGCGMRPAYQQNHMPICNAWIDAVGRAQSMCQ